MSIRRAPRPASNFYVLDKSISEDKRLSWAARGMLVYLLGKPDHWKVSVAALVNETTGSARQTGRDGVYSLLRELEEAGYLVKSQGRRGGGRFDQNDYVVTETPAPLPAQPLADEPTQVSTESKQVLNTSKTMLRSAPHPVTLPEGVDPELWAAYVRHYHYLQEEKGKPVPPAWEAKALRILADLVTQGSDQEDLLMKAINSDAGLLLPTQRTKYHHHGHTGH